MKKEVREFLSSFSISQNAQIRRSDEIVALIATMQMSKAGLIAFAAMEKVDSQLKLEVLTAPEVVGTAVSEAILETAIERGIRKYVLGCLVQEVATWGATWLSGEDRSVESADRAYVNVDWIGMARGVEIPPAPPQWEKRDFSVTDQRSGPKRPTKIKSS